MKKTVRILTYIVAAMMILAAWGGAATADDLTKEARVGYYLDTVITLTAYTNHPELLDAALERCGELENKLSRTIEGSDVWNINHAEGKTVTVSPETVEILQTAIQVSEMSGGAFDVTIAPASTLWDFTSGETKIPATEDLASAAEKIDYRKIRIDGNDVTLEDGMMIDLGGIAKGYIADTIKKELEEKGIQSAILSWKVGVQDIDGATGETMLVSLNYGGSTVTSGIYERGFTLDGVTYHHILSSETGWPVQNELASVTIFSESSMLGDALSTATFALGTEKGARLIESLDGVEALFIARDRAVSGTSGVEKYLKEGTEFSLIPLSAEEPEAAEPAAAEAAAEETDGTLTLLIQVRETDTAPGYILLQGADSIGFLPLPEEGERTQEIIQTLEDGSVWRNVIRMTPEGFSMIESDCEGKDCIEEGEVTLENRQDRLLWNMVICAPHRLTLSLYTPEEAVELSKTILGF